MHRDFMGRPSQVGGTSLTDHLYKNAGKSQYNMKGGTHGSDINVCVVGHYVKSISRNANIDLKRRNILMKCRGIVVIDYDIEGSFLEAAEEQTKLQDAIAGIVKGNKRVIFHQVDMKERRGDQTPDIKSMKFRNS